MGPVRSILVPLDQVECVDAWTFVLCRWAIHWLQCKSSQRGRPGSFEQPSRDVLPKKENKNKWLPGIKKVFQITGHREKWKWWIDEAEQMGVNVPWIASGLSRAGRSRVRTQWCHSPTSQRRTLVTLITRMMRQRANDQWRGFRRREHGRDKVGSKSSSTSIVGEKDASLDVPFLDVVFGMSCKRHKRDFSSSRLWCRAKSPVAPNMFCF